MTENISNYIFLWEYDIPLELNSMLNAEAGIYSWVITQEDNDYSEAGYQNTIKYAIKSFRFGNIYFVQVDSLVELRLTDNSFYYDSSTTELYVRREDWRPLLGNVIYAGAATGYSLGNLDFAYFNNIYYAQIIKQIFSISKEKDQFYFGNLKFQQGTVELITTGGDFDDWASRNLFNQQNRVLIGENGDDYEDFEAIFSGQIGRSNRNWSSINVEVEDIRKAMTRSVAYNLLNQTDWPYLKDKYVGKPKPVAYGYIYNAKCYCMNGDESSPSYYTFLMCDTYFNSVHSISAAYIDDEAVSIYDYDLSAGTFRLTFAIADGNLTKVTADFRVNIHNGVDILKDLILNYDNKPYLASFWDLTETDIARGLARNTSVYVNNKKKLKDVIKDVAEDIQGLFFAHDDGTYTVRIFDEDRTPAKTIYKDEWIPQDTEPEIEDYADEFMTSCVVQYRKDQKNREFREYENTDDEQTAFDTYKNYKTETFETGLTTLADAQAYSEEILQYRTSVPVVVEREVKFNHYDLEIMDFLICDPLTRIDEDPVWGVWEIIGINKNISEMTIGLTLRYIKAYTPIEYVYSYILYNTAIITYNGEAILYREVV